MSNEGEIEERLRAAGLGGEEIVTVMRDVTELILRKAAAAYTQTLPQELQEQLTPLSEQETMEFIAKHKGSFPNYPQSEFDRIHDETWNDYFRSVA